MPAPSFYLFETAYSLGTSKQTYYLAGTGTIDVPVYLVPTLPDTGQIWPSATFEYEEETEVMHDHVGAADPHPVYLTQAEADALYAPVSITEGPGEVRETATLSTTTLTSGAHYQSTILLAPSYRLLKVTCSAPCRVRLYTTGAKQAADLPRSIGTDPTGDSGLMFEFVAVTTLLSADLSPVVDGFDGRTVPNGTIPITVTNTGPAPAFLVVDLLWIRTE